MTEDQTIIIDDCYSMTVLLFDIQWLLCGIDYYYYYYWRTLLCIIDSNVWDIIIIGVFYWRPVTDYCNGIINGVVLCVWLVMMMTNLLVNIIVLMIMKKMTNEDIRRQWDIVEWQTEGRQWPDPMLMWQTIQTNDSQETDMKANIVWRPMCVKLMIIIESEKTNDY